MKRCLALASLGLLGAATCFAQMRIPANPLPDELLQINQSIEGCHLEVMLNDGQTVVLSSAKVWPETLIGVDERNGTWTQIFHDRIMILSPLPRGEAALTRGDRLTSEHCTISSPDQLPPEGFEVAEQWKQIDGERIIAHSLVGAATGAVSGALALGICKGAFGFTLPAGQMIGLGALIGASRGALESMVPPAPRYPLPLSLVFPGVERSTPITLKLTSFQAETVDQICIRWNGKRLWLSKSEVNIERDDEYTLLTVPEKLLEAE